MPGGELQFKGLGELDAAAGSLPVPAADAPDRSCCWTISSRAAARSGEFIKGEKLYNDLRDKIAELQRGIHVAADTTTAVGQALYTDELYRKISEPLRQLDASLAQLAGRDRGAGGALAARHPAV